MTTTAVSITLPSETLARVDAVAADARVARSWLITTVLNGWLDQIDQAAMKHHIPRAEIANVAIAESLEIGQ